jgi:hypothetical protein
LATSPQSQLYPAVSVLPAIALTSPANGANYAAPATIPLAAGVTTNNEAIQYVAFYNNGSLIANVTNAPFQYSWTGVPGGPYNLSATAVYNAGWTVGSATNSVTVSSLSAPAISGISGGNLNYSGGAGSQFVLLKTTDLTQPRIAWLRVHTNYTSSGSFPIPLGSENHAFYTIKAE